MRFSVQIAACVFVLSTVLMTPTAGALEVATFQIDATPPVGAPLCDALVPPAAGVNDPLSARGLILRPDDDEPIVLVAVDWVGIGNEGHDAWREALAEAVDTDLDRVSVHALHQHDAPGCDFLADRIAQTVGLGGKLFDAEFARTAIARAASAAEQAAADARRVTRIAYGEGLVEKVASNRRILGPDGRILHGRMTACPDPEVRAYPVGVIDPQVKLIELAGDDGPIAVLTYYATHPQSYYRTGQVSADFVGMARDDREADVPGVRHIHFNGAGGNIGAGKYNDGSPENRPVLAARLAEGMRRAWENRRSIPTDQIAVDWDVRRASLPPSPALEASALQATIADENVAVARRLADVRDLAWLERCSAGRELTIGRLRIGPIDVLHLPGELFVEYQLAAQAMRPEAFVCMAAYGDYGMGYIGVAEAYLQGGYETSGASRVSPRAEQVLMSAIDELLR